MDVLRVGVVGLGTWGETHLATYADHPGVELTAVCDLDEERLGAAARRHGPVEQFTDYHEMVGLEELDAVSVVTPDFTHAEVVCAAVEAGKAVLVEKPLATTMEDCDRIGAALHERPVPFMIDFHNRWNPGVALIRKEIAGGAVGAVQMVYYRLSDTIFVPTQMLPWAGRSSVNWFLGSHCLDTLRWLLGDEVARLYSVSESRVLAGRGIETPDYYLSILEFAGGARAVLETCWILPESSPSLVDFKLEVVAERGAFHFDGSPHRLVKVTESGPECPDTFIAPMVHGRPTGFATESIRHFADCVLSGREPMVGYADGREVTRLILAMEESARTGQPVEV
jgi:predicted dehydrogenase